MEIVSLGSEVFDIANNDDKPPGIAISLQELQVIEEHDKQYHGDAVTKSRMLKIPQDK